MNTHGICKIDDFHSLIVERIGDLEWIWEVNHSCRGPIIKAETTADVCGSMLDAMFRAQSEFCIHVLSSEFNLDLSKSFSWEFFNNSKSSIMHEQNQTDGGLIGAIKRATKAIAGKSRNTSMDAFEFNQVQSMFLVDCLNRISDLNDQVNDLQETVRSRERDLQDQAAMFNVKRELFDRSDKDKTRQTEILTNMINEKSNIIDSLSKNLDSHEQLIKKLEDRIRRMKKSKPSRTK